MNKKTGFTLLEIVVVIAIIGILTGVVLTVLSSARSSAADATIKSSLEGLRKETSIYFNDDSLGNGSYGNFATAPVSCLLNNATFLASSLACGNSAGADLSTFMCNAPAIKSRELIKQAIDASGSTSPGSASRCRFFTSNNGGWVAGVILRSDPASFWCVDSSGNSKPVTGALVSMINSATVACP